MMNSIDGFVLVKPMLLVGGGLDTLIDI